MIVCTFEAGSTLTFVVRGDGHLMTDSPRANVAARRGVRHMGSEAGARRLVAAPRRRVAERQVEHLHVVCLLLIGPCCRAHPLKCDAVIPRQYATEKQ